MSSGTSTSHEILKSKLTQLLGVITVPDRLANDLSVADLISGSVRNRVLQVPSDNYTKASKLVNEVLTSLKVFNDSKTLVRFCHVLKDQDNPNLDRIANAMLKELGTDVPEKQSPIESDNGFLATSEDIQQPPPQPLIRKQIKNSVPINPAVLREYHSDICDILNTSDDTLQNFAGKLYAQKVISKDTKNSVTRKGGRRGADSLLDHIHMKAEHDRHCLQLVVQTMENDEYLCNIVRKMKGENKHQTVVTDVTDVSEHMEQQEPATLVRRPIKKPQQNGEHTSNGKQTPPHFVINSRSGCSKTQVVSIIICTVVLIIAGTVVVKYIDIFKEVQSERNIDTSTLDTSIPSPSPSVEDNSGKTKENGKIDSVAAQHTLKSDGGNNNKVQRNKKPELTDSEMKTGDRAGDGTGGLIPDDEDLLYYLSDVTQMQELCSSLHLGTAECSVIAKQYPQDFGRQKSEMLHKWRQLESRTWKDFIRPLALLKICGVAKELASEHSVYFDPLDKEDKKVLSRCKVLIEHE